MKLTSSIPSNSVKLIDLYNKITSRSLILGPNFQRKLVWKKQHKYAFIETILLNFPFPEIYIASEEVDTQSLKSKEVVVDGKQRLSTIVDYIQNKNDFNSQKRVENFDDLTTDEKKEFLNYLITVKDLKDIGKANIIEVFKRINSTNYSLNSNEILNAEYGGSEFAIFSKQLTDKKYTPTERETEVLIDKDVKESVNDFFEKNKVFSDNDIKRMFDAQYIMLISATILDGGYFGRSSRINYYLEKYNDEFSNYNEMFEKFNNSISIIDKFNFSTVSYWFNKANLFTLIIELNNVKREEIDLNKLELKLVDLESKVDIYYNGSEEDLKTLSSDETRYFEVARQGSHELAARKHRGKVIRSIIEDSKLEVNPKTTTTFLDKNIKKLNTIEKGYSVLIPTVTGLNKSIMDAVSSVREFLKINYIHDFDNQEFGPNHKNVIQGNFNVNGELKQIDISLYRSNGRGDYRLWFSELNSFASANDNLAIVIVDNVIQILNITKYDYTDIL